MSADIHITLFTLMSDKNFSFEELATSASLARGVYGYVRDKATGTEDVNNKNGKLIDLGLLELAVSPISVPIGLASLPFTSYLLVRAPFTAPCKTCKEREEVNQEIKTLYQGEYSVKEENQRRLEVISKAELLDVCMHATDLEPIPPEKPENDACDADDEASV